MKMQVDSCSSTLDFIGKRMKKDKLLIKLVKQNLSHLIDIQIVLGLAALLSILKSMHSFIKFAQSREVFVCDYVAVIQTCILKIQAFHLDNQTSFEQDVFGILTPKVLFGPKWVLGFWHVR